MLDMICKMIAKRQKIIMYMGAKTTITYLQTRK